MALAPRAGRNEPDVSDLATQVARLYFDRQLSKVEIATRLGMSRFRVARLIDGALIDGLVRIEYRDVPIEDVNLARTIEIDSGSTSARSPLCRAPTARALAWFAWLRRSWTA